jgi:hypothetical protein
METDMRRFEKRPGADRSTFMAVLATTATIWGGLLAGASPDALEAQDTGAQVQVPPIASVDDELLGVAARLHLQVMALQEVFVQERAQYHDPLFQDQARENFSTGMEEVLEAHGMTAAQYELILFVIGTDEETRTGFDQMLDRIRSGSG